ncbi:centrosomal protein of 135 kDa [Hyla sarda]|uniref:centrosomal protein of 135 kDa n=1 Tax=Hyla sarda TaxID=327740 RepID=UPI0024C31D3D|nr:centrosomal protein of 135 kDa [Hyla sarda]XP_056414348.1 centrosomal protein of 135 kDa [Hyla sarda]
MSTAAERKFINLRKRLDQLGYKQPLGIESLPLVEKLFSDLVHTTESLRNTKLNVGKNEKENKNLDALIEPYKAENARLVRENNELHLELLKIKEESDRHIKDLKASLRKFEHQTADLKFLNNQYVHKIRSMEKESKAKAERIQQLQEKNLQAVVQTPGGKKRNIPFRRQRMQIDQPVPPSGINGHPVPQPEDPYVADLLQVADDRIQELQQDVTTLQVKLETSDRAVKHLTHQVELRDTELERLALALDGGRSHDVISLEARYRSNEKLVAHLNLQIEYLQQANQDLEKRVQELQETRQNVTSEVANLSTKNEELCKELLEIDQMAQQLERDKETVLVTADAEIEEAKVEVKRLHIEINRLESTLSQYKSDLSTCEYEKNKLADELETRKDESRKLESLLNHAENEKQRLSSKLEKQMVTEREMVLEIERMRTKHGILRTDRSPSRLDSFVKSLEEERDHYRMEVEKLERALNLRSSNRSYSLQDASRTQSSPGKDSGSNAQLRRLTRERDDLQNMLDRFEKHMVEIQSNVKVLTMERDKFRLLYEQAQNELTLTKQDLSPFRKSAQSGSELRHLVEERDLVQSDLRQIQDENEGLRDKMKVQQEVFTSERFTLAQKTTDLESTIHMLETERLELKSSISELKEKISSLDNINRSQSITLAQTQEDSSQYKAELISVRLLNEQLQKSMEELQHRLIVKSNEIQLSQEEIGTLEERIGELNHKVSVQATEITALKNTISVLDKEKDNLQEEVDEKTERVACLDENLGNKEKSVTNLQQTLSQLEAAVDQLKDSLSNKDRELASLRRQLDSAHSDLTENVKLREISLKENRRLQNDLATMARENQTVTLELENAIHEKEELKLRVHSYISEVSRIETLMASKEQENRDLLDQFRMVHSQAEEWEVKAQNAIGESSSIKMELLSVDTDRRHLRERLEDLENEVQEHMNAHQAYEAQISSMAKALSKFEEQLRHEQDEKALILSDLASVRELCVKLDSSKEQFSKQLTTRNMEYERVLDELEDMKSEAELLKKQLASERLTIKNLETLLASNREKEFQSHLSSHEKESEIQLLKDKLTLAESKLNSHSREATMLRNKLTQLQSDYDIAKRQLTTERFERERAVQELRRHGLSTSSIRTSSPLTSTMKSPALSPERSILRPVDRGSDKLAEKSVSFKD